MKISVCMIVRDEEEVLARCLQSIKGFADEIIIADTGSVDKTVKIASEFTDKIYSFPWVDDFAAARNFAFSKGSGDYLMWMDADDVLPEESFKKKEELLSFLEKEGPDLLRCPYEMGVCDCATRFYRERLIKRSAEFSWVGRVHECIVPRGKIEDFPLPIVHLGSKKDRSHRNLRIYQKWAAEEPLSPRDLFYYGRELYYHKLYTEGAAILSKMIAGEGWYVNKIEACRILGLCYAAHGERDKALRSYFLSFCFGEPRAVILCEIGKIFREESRFRQAVYWYELALQAKDHSAEGDFDDPACRTIVPLLELVCCHYALGEKKIAEKYHKITEERFPQHPSVAYNRQFFE